MKLSTKLRISFCILVLVPVCLFTVAAFGLIRFSVFSIEEQYNASGTSYMELANPVALVNKICENEYNLLLESSINTPEDFVREEYLNTINTELQKKNAYLIIVESDECIYAGQNNYEPVLNELDKIDFGQNNTSVYLGKQQQILVNNIAYTSVTGKEGMVYVVMQVRDIVPQVKNLLYNGIIAIIIVLVLTSGIFVSWMYKTMVTPINKLKLATYNIKNGNLDFRMDASGRDEISELCRDFDDMRKRLKENAEEKLRADMESKELISNISHDLKTPITAIKGYSEGILDGVADNQEKMDRYVRTIYNKACDMDKLINELTLYAKMDSNKVAYNFLRLNVGEYFDECVEELKLDLESLGIELVYTNNLPREIEMVADAEQIKRVINNIVSNSVKYMNHEDGRINITIQDCGQQLEIDIADNGAGISPEDLPFIFDRFYRADASRNSAKGGSGIGLSIVKKIIYDHNGSITVDSEFGKGTTMHILLDKYVELPPQVRRISH